MAYTHVDTPFHLRGLELKNRIVRTAHGTNIGAGTMSDDLIAYHGARARGGTALSILEIMGVHRSSAGLLNAWDPELPAGMRKLVAACRPHGMRIFQQLWHGGIQGPNIDTGIPWSASDVASHKMNIVPEPMTQAMIDEVVASYAEAARLCEEWGLDGVEIHCAHSYLPHQFLSPGWNRRTDRYGGSLENRARFVLETVAAVRAAVSASFVVGVRVSPDYQDGGLTPDDVIRVVRMLEERDLVDFVDVSAGNYTTDYKMIGAMHEPVGYELETSAPITRAIRSPTIVTGRFRTLDDADLVIRGGDADLVSVVRGTIADPDLVAKSLTGKSTEVRPCIGCNQGCVGGIMAAITGPGGRMGCTVNPAAGFERTLGDDKLVPAATPKKVMIVGGGVGGMEAARVAALRGHRVVLAEAAPDLGGMAALAARQPTRHAIHDILVWQQNAIYDLGVDVRLSTYVEAEDVEVEAPDVVIIATGALPRMDGVQVSNPAEPAIGMNQPHVLSSVDLFSGARTDLGETALIVDDVGHYEAMGVAEELLNRGLDVSFVTRHPAVAHQLDGMFLSSPTLARFPPDRFTPYTRSRLVSIEADRATIAPVYGTGASNSGRRTVPADTVVFVSYNRPNRDLHTALAGRGIATQLIGDARNPRTMQEAIREGYLAAMHV